MSDNPQNMIGATHPAQAPVAPKFFQAPAPAHPGSHPALFPASPRPDVEPVAYSAPEAQPASVAPNAIAAEVGALRPRELSEEEYVLIHALRIVDQIRPHATLSPVQRAFIAGAKGIFGTLAEACDHALKRTAADLVAARAKPTAEPVSTGSGSVTAGSEQPAEAGDVPPAPVAAVPQPPRRGRSSDRPLRQDRGEA